MFTHAYNGRFLFQKFLFVSYSDIQPENEDLFLMEQFVKSYVYAGYIIVVCIGLQAMQLSS